MAGQRAWTTCTSPEYTTWHGLVTDRRVEKQTGPAGYKPCAAPFSQGCILADGTVVPCCLDVNGRMPMGNIAASRFQDIWAGNEYRQLRLQMLTGTFYARLDLRPLRQYRAEYITGCLVLSC